MSALTLVGLLAVSLTLSACHSLSLPSAVEPVTAKLDAKKKNGAILRYDTVHHPVIARNGMVVSQNRLASEVGNKILAAGGNAVDSAIAVGFALAVTLPRAGNLGGSGFMLVHMANQDETVALDFRSAAPAAARLSDFVGPEGEIDWQTMSFGAKAPGVPGTVAGLYNAWQRFGSMPWKDLLAPAIDLASNGIVVTDDLAYVLKEAEGVMSSHPSSLLAYMRPDGSAPDAGQILVQSDLAWSLSQIAESGADAFYKGEIANKISRYMKNSGGYISLSDLAAYEVKERQAISTIFNGHKVVTMPPVSSGGIALLQMLNVLSEFPLESYPAGSADSLHLIAETMKRVAANRRIGIGDPDFVDVPIQTLLSRQVAKTIAAEINLDTATTVTDIYPMEVTPYESRETTHYSVVDGKGNAVATTYTLGHSFGSGLVIPGTGILLDNQLRNFYHRTPAHANGMQPGKRMLSTMTPTLVFDPQQKLFLVTGSPGGGRIPNIVAQLILNTVQYDMNIAEATHAPRIHQQWRTPQLGFERELSRDTIDILESRGHVVETQQTIGSSQSIMLRNGYFYGSADPRRPGAAAIGLDTIAPQP